MWIYRKSPKNTGLRSDVMKRRVLVQGYWSFEFRLDVNAYVIMVWRNSYRSTSYHTSYDLMAIQKYSKSRYSSLQIYGFGIMNTIPIAMKYNMYSLQDANNSYVDIFLYTVCLVGAEATRTNQPRKIEVCVNPRRPIYRFARLSIEIT